MSRLDTYNPSLLQYQETIVPVYAGAPFVPGSEERMMPSLLGVATGLYLLSVITMSTASENVSWIPQVVGVGLGLLWVVVGVLVRGQPIAWSRPITFFVLFCIWAALGILVTIDADYFLNNYMTGVKVTIVTWICLQCVRTRKDYLACCLLIGVGGILVLGVGYDTIMRAIEFTGTRVQKGARAEGTLISNSNELGQFGVIVGFASASCILGYKNLVMRLISTVPLIAGLYIIASSGSRTAMVGVVGSAIGVYWFHFRTAGSGSAGRKLILAFLAIAFLGGTAYYIQKLPFFFRLITVFSSTDAMKDEPRLQYFFNALEACAEHPVLGLGIGGFALARYGVNAENVGHYSHSSVSETLSCTGVLGFLLYFGSRLAVFTLALRTRRLNLSANEKATVNMLLAYLGALVLFDIVAVTIHDRLMWPLMGAACGYLWHLNHRSTEPSFLAAAG